MDGVNILWLASPELALESQPGQFVMIRCADGFDPLLRRALSVHRVRSAGYPAPEQGIAVLYGVHGAGTGMLTHKRPGDPLDVIGPLGNGFSVNPNARRLLLAGSGWGVSPLIALAEQQVARGCDVTLVAGAPDEASHYPYQQLPAQIEVILATDDGSIGRQTAIADLLPDYLPWADAVFACGPWSLYQSLASGVAPGPRQKPIQVLLESVMACGVGACYACAVETRRGLRLSCREGPKFELKDLLL